MFERLETARLILRKPVPEDAERIFAGYASDPEVTRLLGWSRHTSIEDTRAFLEFNEGEWARWPAGPYLVESRVDGSLLGSSGLIFQTPDRAVTGYALAREAWGKGFATEALRAVVEVARSTGIARLEAVCHPENLASTRVLEKCGFVNEGIQPRAHRFPNLHPTELYDVFRYGLTLR